MSFLLNDNSPRRGGFALFLLIVIIILFACGIAKSQCPVEGMAKNDKDAQANKLKNREIVIGVVDTSVTLEKLLAPGNDLDRFSQQSFVSITGYLVEVKAGGQESCNCKAVADSLTDTHIYIGLTPTAAKSECVIVEITPRFKKLNKHFNVKSYTGKLVTVTGFIFTDEEHKGNAVNTCGKCTNNWRKTVNEIHPVVSITLK